MKNILNMDAYMAFELGEYLKEVCQLFSATNPSIGSNKLAYCLLDHAFLKMCGHLEQKLTNMAWFLGYHDIERAKEIYNTNFYQGKLTKEFYKNIFKAYCLFMKKTSLYKEGDNYKIANILKADRESFHHATEALNNESLNRLFEFTDSKYNSFRRILSRLSNKEIFKKEEFLKFYGKAVDYRNMVAHNKNSIYSRENCSLSALSVNNIYQHIFVICFVDKTICRLFKEATVFITKYQF